MSRIFQSTHTVRFYELDYFGHVHHAEIVKYFEWARMDYLKQAGLSFQDLMNSDVYIVIVNANIDFKSPAMFDEMLVISGQVSRIGNTSWSMTQHIEEKESNRRIAEADFTFVCLDGNRQKIEVPRDLLKPLLD